MKIALKNFLTTLRRNKAASLLNVLGLSLAFTVFYIIASQVWYSVGYNHSLREPHILGVATVGRRRAFRQLALANNARGSKQISRHRSVCRPYALPELQQGVGESRRI